ncbi:transglycosylase domain-containing protein [Deinococcus hopiensis]|uniref:peptidoglycan glycosyltransferase n=1 Tax=Deinococcus hopiensis KR-140 TaxID=695939 RepID=A0A1W1VPY7_9DEIO|nr:transglycosylase domain-containing protein [Deinococcus hopiensis]SMB95418.1 Membrane carboxypeptidase (penicillin-binding protein) [Deinococcus hopiensis KR-140]
MRFFTGLGVLLLLGVGGAGGLWWTWGRDLPSVSDLDVLEFSGQTRVYDRQGTFVGTLTPSLGSGASENRHLLKLGEVSPWLQKAIVTSEDRRFYEHHGVDYIGIARGLIKGVLKNDLEGGSSITQQVVKNTLLSDLHSARTAERKFKEAVLAYQLERNFNKDQILNAYLNVIYWGNGGRSDIIGAETAARAYFKKSASELNLAESVYLTTIVPAPNRRYKNFEAYRPLMKNLLARMVEDGRVTQAEAEAAWKTPIYPAGWRIAWKGDGTVTSARLERPERIRENIAASDQAQGVNRYQYLHYMQAVERELLPKIGRKALYGGGKIYTSMDLKAQQAAEKASLNAQLPGGATLGAALVSPRNGEVLALVGQKLVGGRPSDWNNATQARRQVGSSIKPLLYTLALEKGWKQSDTVLDSPLTGSYQPQNYDRRWTGRFVTMRYALDHSLNLPTVRIGQEVGMDDFGAKLRELGLTPPPDAGLSLSIGTLEASPLQMAAAYAAFANGGLYYAPSLVRRMEDARGQVLYARSAPAGKRVWDARAAWLGLDMIRGVVNDLTPAQGGLATKAQIPGWDVGGKTGTTNDVKDLWFAGVTPMVVGAVWVGKQGGGSLPSWAYSGDVPTPVWQQAVAGALAGQPRQTFLEPPGIGYKVVRQVNMAFRQEQLGEEQLAHDGTRRDSGGGGLFGRRSNPAPTPEPEPVPQPSAQQPGTAQQPAPDSEGPDLGGPDSEGPDSAGVSAGGVSAGGLNPAQDQATPVQVDPTPDTSTPEAAPGAAVEDAGQEVPSTAASQPSTPADAGQGSPDPSVLPPETPEPEPLPTPVPLGGTEVQPEDPQPLPEPEPENAGGADDSTVPGAASQDGGGEQDPPPAF